jgi:hypothetical protein
MEIPAMTRRLVLSAALATFAALPALAHHGWGSYDADNPMTIEGEIVEVAVENPHGEMTLEHDGEGWRVTLAPLSRMNARGATAEVLRPGVPVTAHGYPRRDGTPEIRAEWIEVGGTRIPLR